MHTEHSRKHRFGAYLRELNKYNTEKIVTFCRENNIEVVGRIPFSPKVTAAMVNGKTIVEYLPRGTVAKEIEGVWEKISSLISGK